MMVDVLPEWPGRTIGVFVTCDGGLPHAIPVSAPVRAGDSKILLNLHRSRQSIQRLRKNPHVALLILAAGNIAFSARGTGRVLQESMTDAPDYAVVAIDVEEVDDHRQPAFVVEAGVDRRWLDDREREALARRVHELTDLAST